MIGKYNYHNLQTSPWHLKEEPHNNHETQGRLSKATSSLFPIKMIAKLEWTQSNVQQNIEQLQTPTMGVTINKKVNNRTHLRTDSSLRHGGWRGGLNAFYWYQIFALDSAVVELQEMFYWYQIFALDSAVVELQEMFCSHGSLLTIAMYHHGETLIK